MYELKRTTWYGYDNRGYVRDTFYGSYMEAVDYFNYGDSNPFVVRFDDDYLYAKNWMELYKEK